MASRIILPRHLVHFSHRTQLILIQVRHRNQYPVINQLLLKHSKTTNSALMPLIRVVCSTGYGVQKNISQTIGNSGLVSTGVSTSTGMHKVYYLLNIIKTEGPPPP